MDAQAHTDAPQDIIQLGILSLSSLCPACVGLGASDPSLEKIEPVTDTPSPTASREEGGEVLRGNSDDFLQEEIFVMSFEG